MKFWSGMLLGILLTVVATFAFDSITGRASNGLTYATSDRNPPIVNWDVVNDGWHRLTLNLQALGEDLQRGWKRLAG